MVKLKKMFVVFLAAVACFSLAIGLAACSHKDKDEEPEKVTIKLAGQTANESGEYSAEITAKNSVTYTLIVGALTDYELSAQSSAADVASASVTQTTLTVNALKEGSAKVTLSEKSGKANDLVLNVTVNAAPSVAPTGLYLSDLTEDKQEKTGSGTLADPYTVTLAAGKSSTHNMTVQPSGADNTFVWTVGTVENETFTAGEGIVTASQSGSVLNISSTELTEGDSAIYYIKGEAQTGDLTVYVKVTVEKYVELESISVTGLIAAEDPATDGYDYILRTAKGTNWNLDQVAKRLTSGMGKGENERPANDNVSYYHNVNVFKCVAKPADATNTEWVITEEGDAGIFNPSPDGTWQTTGAGETIVKITNSANEASVKIKLIVEDTLYTGILKSKYNELEAATDLDWAFDNHADDTVVTARSLLEKWHFAMNKTTSLPDFGDGNQKIFWLGGADRPYGFDIETRLDTNTGATTGDTLALAWTKATIPAGADKLKGEFGSHTSDSYTLGRIVLVKEDGTSYVLNQDWENLGGQSVEYAIPAECKGATVAVVLEVRLTTADENSEFQCKGLWITTPITKIKLGETTATVSQGSTYNIEYTTVPAKVVDDRVEYSVSTEVDGGNDKIVVDSKGVVKIDRQAPEGVYVITVTSVAENTVKATLTLTVEGYVAVSEFTGKYTNNNVEYDLANAQINAKQGANAVDIAFAFNADASTQTYTISYKDSGSETSATTSNIAFIEKGKLSFLSEGSVVITVTPDAEEATDKAITFTVTVNAGSVLNWGTAGQNNGDKISTGDNPWAKHDSTEEHNEGLCLHNGGYIDKDIDVSDMSTLELYVRTFVRNDTGEVSAKMYVQITYTDDDGQEQTAYVDASGYESDDHYIVIECKPGTSVGDKWDSAQKVTFDISAYSQYGNVKIKVGNAANEKSSHCAIQQITIS